VRDIAQDANGYLWLATYAGLVKFDGVRFVRQDRFDRSLPSDDLSALLITRNGSIWVGGVVGGVTHILGTHIVTHTSPEGLFDGYVFSLLEDRTGTIWVAAQGGLARINGQRWERLGTANGLPDRPASSLYQDQNGVIWVGTSAGLYKGGAPYEKFEAVASVPHSVEGIASTHLGEILTTHPTRLLTFVTGPSTNTHTEMPDFHGTRVMRDRRGSLWVGTRGRGIVRLQPASPNRPPRLDQLTHHDGLSSDSVLSLFEDREGQIWAGTPFGLNRLSENSVIPVLPDENTGGHVRSVVAAEDSGVWTSTAEALLRYSSSQRSIYGRRIPGSGTINALHTDKQRNALWIARNGGIIRYRGDRFEPFLFPDGTTLTRVRSMVTDTAGRLWLCDGDRGVFRSTDATLRSFELIAGDKPASSLFASRNGSVWIGFVNGTVRQVEGVNVVSYSEAQGLPGGGTVTAMYEDRSDNFWVGTHRGLSRFENGRFLTIRSHNGLPGPGPIAIVDDEDGNLWLGVTGVGLLKTTRADFDHAVATGTALAHHLYGESDGLRATPVRWFGAPTSARTKDGTLWFLTGHGLAVVDPARLHEPRATPAVRIEGAFADERDYPPDEEVNFPAGTTTLRIDYTLTSLAPLSQAKFRYRLEGLDDQWVEAGDRRQAFYTNVPPGRYRFLVEASIGTPQQVNGTYWMFSIRPRFYQTTWFAASAAMLLTAVMWALWRFRLSQVQRRFGLVLDERVRMGREIHDTLLQGLVGVAVQFKVIGDQLPPSAQAARDRLERVRKLVEHYIAETRQSIWDLRSPSLLDHDLTTALREAGRNIVGDNNIGFDVVVRGKAYACPPRVEEQLLRVGSEAVSNAIRHAEPSRVTIELVYQRDAITLRVIDDGAGFDADDPGFTTGGHWGLASMRERAQQMNARLNLTSEPGRGTQLELIVPAASMK
jgi:signal transduction histidine kinase/ligand-binding sensor domain-containing protein